MSIPSREIGWSEKSNTLWRISKQLNRLMVVWSGCCNTLTTTTTILPCECDTILTVGKFEEEEVYGYQFEGFGTLDPNCQNILYLVSYIDQDDIFVLELGLSSETCCSSITIEIDEIEYTLLSDGMDEDEGICIYTLGDISNPFPAVGETCIVRMCNTVCTTTTEMPN